MPSVVVTFEQDVAEISSSVDTVEIESIEVEVVDVGMQGLQGPVGPSGNSLPAIYFSYGDATPDTIYTPTSDLVISGITLIVTTAFNGTGAKVSIGTDADHELLLAEDESDLSEAASWSVSPHVEVADGTPIKVWITPGGGASQGQATILIEYVEA